MTAFQLEYTARSDTGRVRTLNQDAVATLPTAGMVVIADGMGGYQGGEVASRLAVDGVLAHLAGRLHADVGLDRCLDAAEAAAHAAHAAICQQADLNPKLRGMGTTLVLGLFRPAHLGYVWVGDSRLYRLRAQSLTLLTSDHTLAREMVRRGVFASLAAAAAAGVGENILIRALGADPSGLVVDRGCVAMTAGDVYLFCSDGLNHMLDDATIQTILADTQLGLDAKANRLVDLALAAGGSDNITLVLVTVTTGLTMTARC